MPWFLGTSVLGNAQWMSFSGAQLSDGLSTYNLSTAPKIPESEALGSGTNDLNLWPYMAMRMHTNHSVRPCSFLSVITEKHKVTPNMLSSLRTKAHSISVLFLPTASSKSFLIFPVRKHAIRNPSTFIQPVSSLEVSVVQWYPFFTVPKKKPWQPVSPLLFSWLLA